MKCIINLHESVVGWVREFFPDYPPYLLPFANKPYLEYLTDYCVLAGIREIRILTDTPSPELSEAVEKLKLMGLDAQIFAASLEDRLRYKLLKNRAFCEDDDLLVLSGMIWLDYDKHAFVKPESPEPICGTVFANGVACCLIRKGFLDQFPEDEEHLPPPPDGIHLERIGSVKDYFDRNMKIVYEQASCYDLPGYGDSVDFIVGQNVGIPKTAEVKTPVILGDSVMLEAGSTVGPGAILGSNILVDSDASIRDSVILGNSYVGCNLEVIGKICYRNYLIDPVKNLKLDIVDEFLLTQLTKQGVWFVPVKQRLIALLMLIVYTIPYLLLRPLLSLHMDEVECFMNRQRKRKLRLHLFVRPPKGVFGRYFMKLSLDRYHLLWRVVAGQLRLVGSYLLEVNEENAHSLEQFPDYAPGIFSYSEYLEHEKDPFQREIDELYYMYHASFWRNLKILKGILIRNMMKRF